MRFRVATVVLLLLAACTHQGERTRTPSVNAALGRVDPANIRRVRRDLPPGYEVATVSGVAAPQLIWGLGGSGEVTPAQCAALVVQVPTGPVALDHSLVAQCRQWSMTGRRAGAHVHLVDPPHVDAAETLGMAAEISTSVEGGNEIISRATTFIAYLGDYYAFTTLISDPGSPDPALTPQFAADLLVKTVSALHT
jgi:hypothetical protein